MAKDTNNTVQSIPWEEVTYIIHDIGIFGYSSALDVVTTLPNQKNK